ncbi:HXXEE domain-containing protein [Streptococcus sp. zg-86]|uniref:HXXEE domain-containing protein n=1 Tax=Streptococcus zhangguiae TaxID=2664091 RepID=A0A6I4RTC7_9STRE|nr:MULTISPECIES: HXXEE domain-containing protein [unclassified Streptococcus]MTB64154.1 HXXEE domain-containing protein [Streptococcus sp. zg-86]MTB90520.1 HXXEE domain-containing protein [Streptococcus sp. zg-36]MWV56142.1 HXXEE domain-containing protein [Streptococcus sp. zg-70]QTH48234.1 HXXEE domain-containing protein [Streptococcus sp. zg-86]
MKKMINNWYNISIYLAGLTALLAIFLPVTEVQKCLLASICILFLHFFEEFGYPGGFPLLGVKLLLGTNEMDKTKWDCNNLSSMFGNWTFLILVYVFPLLLPNVRFLTLSAMLFLLMEVIMHSIFNLRLKSIYNAGLITAILGLGPIGLYYFINLFDSKIYIWYDYALAVLWFIIVFIFCFRSKIYWELGKKDGYVLTDQTAFGVNQLTKN